jgi:peptidoglycan-associated lipoprotein
MKIKSFVIIGLVIALGFFLTGCGCFYQQQKGEAPPPPPPQAQVTPPPAKVEVPVPQAPPAPVAVAVPALQGISFDFDKYNIRPGDAEILKGDYGWFKANAGKRVRIEGNCDERGTVEYNLVLGQKRADATKNYLTQLGVDGKLLETVSYGKEKPLCMEHNEGCWAKNRNAQFKALP